MVQWICNSAIDWRLLRKKIIIQMFRVWFLIGGTRNMLDYMPQLSIPSRNCGDFRTKILVIAVRNQAIKPPKKERTCYYSYLLNNWGSQIQICAHKLRRCGDHHPPQTSKHFGARDNIFQFNETKLINAVCVYFITFREFCCRCYPINATYTVMCLLFRRIFAVERASIYRRRCH